MTETQRGLCCHEAGHAVVAWSFGVPVIAVYVSFSVARGWQGGAKYYWRSRALHYMDRVTNSLPVGLVKSSLTVQRTIVHGLPTLAKFPCCSTLRAFPKMSIGRV